MIKVSHLSKVFHENQVLDDLSFSINKGDVVAIIGSSGAGKSTLLRSLNYLEKPDTGEITIQDFTFSAEKPSKDAILQLRKKTAMVFQQFYLFRQKTALENVAEGLVIVKKIPKNEAYQLATSFLEKVGLKDRLHYYPKHLSGGQQQRVAIARALAMEPEVLLLDEPTSALDPELVGEVLETIRKAAEEGNTMILVSHEMNFVRQVANRVLFLEKGKIIEDGHPKDVFENPKSDRTRQFLANFYKKEAPEYII